METERKRKSVRFSKAIEQQIIVQDGPALECESGKRSASSSTADLKEKDTDFGFASISFLSAAIHSFFNEKSENQHEDRKPVESSKSDSKLPPSAHKEQHGLTGDEQFKLGHFQDAIRHYTYAIELEEDSHVIRSNRSACYHQAGRYHEALQDARVAILKAPAWYRGYCRKAASHIALGEFEEARRDYTSALRLNPADPLVEQALAEVHTQLESERATARAQRLVSMVQALQGSGITGELDLRGQSLGDDGAVLLAGQLGADGAAVRRLLLDVNGIADAGATALAEALRWSPGLTALGLSGNAVSNAGATALAAALIAHPALEEVILDGNRVGLAGVEALSRALDANPRIRRLGLSQNRTPDADSDGDDGAARSDRDGGADGGPGRTPWGCGGASRRLLRAESGWDRGVCIPPDPPTHASAADGGRDVGGERADLRSCISSILAFPGGGGGYARATDGGDRRPLGGGGGGGGGGGSGRR
jgi:tetratricopeptide (TPR) repeat protein